MGSGIYLPPLGGRSGGGKVKLVYQPENSATPDYELFAGGEEIKT